MDHPLDQARLEEVEVKLNMGTYHPPAVCTFKGISLAGKECHPVKRTKWSRARPSEKNSIILIVVLRITDHLRRVLSSLHTTHVLDGRCVRPDRDVLALPGVLLGLVPSQGIVVRGQLLQSQAPHRHTHARPRASSVMYSCVDIAHADLRVLRKQPSSAPVPSGTRRGASLPGPQCATSSLPSS